MTADRAEYTAGLRAFADLLDSNPHLRLPFFGATYPFDMYTHGDEQAREVADWARALPGTVAKDVSGGCFTLTGSLRGLKLSVTANRDEVCTRTVTGTERVTRLVPDPAVQVPMVEVTETVETVVWECEPILAERRV